jgi:hypothetical protein
VLKPFVAPLEFGVHYPAAIVGAALVVILGKWLAARSESSKKEIPL